MLWSCKYFNRTVYSRQWQSSTRWLLHDGPTFRHRGLPTMNTAVVVRLHRFKLRSWVPLGAWRQDVLTDWLTDWLTDRPTDRQLYVTVNSGPGSHEQKHKVLSSITTMTMTTETRNDQVLRFNRWANRMDNLMEPQSITETQQTNKQTQEGNGEVRLNLSLCLTE